MKRLCVVMLIAIMAMTMFAASALAVKPGEERVTLGADLTEEQITGIYNDFELTRGDVKEITVTNDEEREYLAGLVPDKKIGKVALSSIYIMTLEEGGGLSVTINNINWCTESMYINALITAGVSDASVKVSAPFPVSGTAALTGVYKAYEDITGESLNQDAKQAGAEELVVTGELAATIGSDEATELINELKKVLDQTKDMTDEELRDLILQIAKQQNVTLTEENIAQIISLVRTLEKLNISDWAEKLGQLQKTTQEISSFFSGIGNFFSDLFSSIENFFSSLFGGK